MRKRAQLLLVVAFVCVSGCHVAPPATSKSGVGESSFSPTGRGIAFTEKKEPTFFDRQTTPSHVAGFYSRTLDLTHGVRVFLFPDNEYLTVLFCDICEPEVFTHGHWRHEGSRVILTETFRERSPTIPTWQDIAEVESLEVVVTLEGKAPDFRYLVPSQRWHNESNRDSIEILDAWVQEGFEGDWHEMKSWLLKKKSKDSPVAVPEN